VIFLRAFQIIHNARIDAVVDANLVIGELAVEPPRFRSGRKAVARKARSVPEDVSFAEFVIKTRLPPAPTCSYVIRSIV
jgi:hypothetical protein